jgi:general secretion pathway protein A
MPARGRHGLVDIDLAKLAGTPAPVDGMSSQLASLGAEQQGDRLQRLERSMLRLERVNIENLGMLQKLVDAGSSAQARRATMPCSRPRSPMR